MNYLISTNFDVILTIYVQLFVLYKHKFLQFMQCQNSGHLNGFRRNAVGQHQSADELIYFINKKYITNDSKFSDDDFTFTDGRPNPAITYLMYL